MSIISIDVGVTGLVGDQVNPRRNTMVTTDNLSTITTAGYLNNQNTGGNPILPTDTFHVIYSFNPATNIGIFGIFTVSYSVAHGYSLVLWENPGNVLLPVVSGNLASFNGTTGQIQDSGIVAANVLVNTAVNTMAAGSEIILDKATATTTAGAATVNKQSGVLTTPALTTASGAAYTITLTNSEIKTTSVILCQIMGGSNTTPGITIIATPLAGSATILLENSGVAAAALNGTVILGFVVF
jgi:hypothetical protein